MPAERGGAAWQMHGVRAQMRQEFPAALDRQRALSESLISAVTRTRPARAPAARVRCRAGRHCCWGSATTSIAWSVVGTSPP
jgi:hypothetical protein